jgi:hypothetical protein
VAILVCRGTYWRYVLAIFDQRGHHWRRDVLVGYARCITLATGAMMAIGPMGPPFRWCTPRTFSSRRWFCRHAGSHRGHRPGGRSPFPQPQSRGDAAGVQAVVIIVLRESRA